MRDPTGSNSGLDEEAVFFFHLGELQTLEAAKKEVGARIKAARAKAKEDGIVLESLDRAKKDLERADDEEPVSAKHAAYERYARFLGLEIGKQTDLFDEHEPAAALRDKAETAGRRRALMGDGPQRNPYDEGSANGQAWLAGWHDGAEQRRIILEMRAQIESDDDGADDEGDGDIGESMPF